MLRSKRLTAALLCGLVCLTGCSGAPSIGDTPDTPGTPDATAAPAAPDLPIETAPVEETPADPGLVYYITGHGCHAPEDVTRLADAFAARGYDWEAGTIDAIPDEAAAVILNAPTEDITSDDQAILDAYLDNGGVFAIVLPASESEMRYKYLGYLMESYCVILDYDRVTETNTDRNVGDAIIVDQIGPPEGMRVDNYPVEQMCMNDVRSFHIAYRENFTNIHHETFLESAESAVGTPCGGTEDDPITYTDECLYTMLYSRDDSRHNSSIIARGSADFLLDENADAPAYVGTRDWFAAAVQFMEEYY